TGKNPTDRGKIGTKRSLLTDGQGVPIGVVVAGGNAHDKRVVEQTIESIPGARPPPTPAEPQPTCPGKSYDYPHLRELVAQYGYTAHIPARGTDPKERQKLPGYRARRWVVERTHSWFNRFRRLLIRWEKKLANYKAFLHFACAWVTYRAAGVLG